MKELVKKFWLWRWSVVSLSVAYMILCSLILIVGSILSFMGYSIYFTEYFNYSVETLTIWGFVTCLLGFIQIDMPINFLTIIFTMTLGSWQPPAWLKYYFNATAKAIQLGSQKLKNFFNGVRHDKAFRINLLKKLSFVGIIAAVLFSIHYLENRPKAKVTKSDQAKKGEANVSVTINKVSIRLNNHPRHNEKDRSFQIYFDKPIWELGAKEKNVDGIMQISPEIEGMWKRVDSNTLTFEAAENWRAGTKYRVQFLSYKFKDESYKFTNTDLFFNLDPIKVSTHNLTLYENPKNPRDKKIIGEIHSSHKFNIDELKKFIELKQRYKKAVNPLMFEVRETLDQENQNDYVYFIHSQNIEIQEHASTVEMHIKDEISIDGQKVSITNNNRSKNIPSINSYFNIEKFEIRLVENEKGEEEQVVIVKATTPIKKESLKEKLKLFLSPSRSYYPVDNIPKDVWDTFSKIDWEFAPTVEDFPKEYLLKIKVPQNTHVFVDLESGVDSYAGFRYPLRIRKFLTVPDYKKQLSIQYQGALLARSGDEKVVVAARNIENASFELYQLLPEQIQHLITQSGSSPFSPRFNSYNFNIDNIAVKEKWEESLTSQDPSKAVYSIVDLGRRLEKKIQGRELKGVFLLNIREKHGSQGDSRLITVTDLGIIIKRGIDHKQLVFVQSLKTGRPVSDATIEVIGPNGLAILKGETDSLGYFEIPSFHNNNDTRAVAILVKDGDDVAYMSINDSNRLVNLSSFDISGVGTNDLGSGFTSYLFDDRGIYRPGEEVRLGFMTKDIQWKQSPQGVPVQWEITNPKGTVVALGEESLNAEGFFLQTFKLNPNAPTGTYTVQLHLLHSNNTRKWRSLLGSSDFQVEEFQPDTMKMNLSLLPLRDGGWVHPDELIAKIQLENLYGKPAINRKIRSTLTLFPHRVRFAKFKDYDFSDPNITGEGTTQNLMDGKTDDKGDFQIKPDLSRYSDATFLLRLRSEGFEADEGRSVVREASTIVSPAKFMIGHKSDGSLYYLKKNQERIVNIISVGSNLERVATPGLKLILEKQIYQKVLVQQANGTFAYETILKKVKDSEKEFAIPAHGIELKIPTSHPGGYIYSIIDADDQKLWELSFDVMGDGNLARRVERNAELLLKLDKEQYSQGGTVRVEIKAPYRGAGLITVERERVFAKKWFVADSETTIQEIELPNDLEGNAYINISYLRASDSTDVHMNPYSFGVIPISINTGKRDLAIELDYPELSKPGELFKVKYRAEGSGKVVIYAVNEGILQLTKYPTPKPLVHFFKKRRLEMITFQTLDLLLPDFDIVKGQLKEGGDSYSGASDNLNPFARKKDPPIAYWSEMVDVDQKWREVTFNVADSFNGKLRVMAVGSSSSRLGSASGFALYRGDIILTPNVPTFAGPGDEFDVNVTVANHRAGSGKDEEIKVKLNLKGGLEVVGAAEQTLKISEGEDQLIRFRVKSTNFLGEAAVAFNASSKHAKSKSRRTMSVRPHTPKHTTSYAAYLPREATNVSLDIDRKIYDEYKELKLTISALPFGLTTGLQRYLQKYPYGCTEQLTSKGFPYLVMLRRPDSAVKPIEARKFINSTLAMLSTRLIDQGGFSLYPGGYRSHDLVGLYASFFIVESKDEGISIPSQLWASAQRFVEDRANNSPTPLERGMAVYLHTRMGKTSSVQATKWVQDFGQPNGNWNDLGAAFVASSYMQMKMVKEAASLFVKIDLLKHNAKSDYYHYYSSMQRIGGLLYLYSKHYPEGVKNLDSSRLIPMFKSLTGGGYNSLSASFIMLGLDAYSRLYSTAEPDKFDVKFTFIDDKQKINSRLATVKEKESGEWQIPSNLTRIELNRLDNKIALFTSFAMTGFDRNPKDSALGRNIVIEKYLYDADDNRVSEAKQGHDYELELIAYTVNGSDMDNVALVDLMVPGFELLPNRDQRGKVPGVNILNDERTDLNLDYIDAREDRVIFYSNLNSMKRKLRYKVKATVSGAFQLPGTLADPMYDRLSKYLGPTNGLKVNLPTAQ